MPSADDISTAPRIRGIVLAGGQGRRMGGEDKGLQPLCGRPLVSWVLERLRPQVDALAISANRNLARYGQFGTPVCPDRLGGYQGPLAGLHAALGTYPEALMASVPCDCPLLPTDLVARLHRALQASKAPAAIILAAGRLQPGFALLRRELAGPLERWLAGGDRRLTAWYRSVGALEVPFDDQTEAFANLNSPEALERLERSLCGRTARDA